MTKIQMTKIQNVSNFEFRISNLFRISIFGFGIFILLLTLTASGQTTPELMVTWKANSYVPPDYAGKVLPSGGSKIEMALELIDNGRLADLSQTEIRWLANNDILRSGRGLKTFSFTADQFRGDQVIDITIPLYKGASLAKRVVIPLARPEVIITRLDQNVFRALLYFFNLTNLSQAQFTWSANGVDVVGSGDNPDTLTLETAGLPGGSVIDLSVQVQNALNQLEIANRSIQFTKQ